MGNISFLSVLLCVCLFVCFSGGGGSRGELEYNFLALRCLLSRKDATVKAKITDSQKHIITLDLLCQCRKHNAK